MQLSYGSTRYAIVKGETRIVQRQWSVVSSRAFAATTDNGLLTTDIMIDT
jgi:hypothetical protein